MPDDLMEELPGMERRIARQVDAAIGHVPLSKPTIVLPPPVRPFPARALRYGPGQAPILERDP